MTGGEMVKIPEHALTVTERLERCGYEAYVVGGCVRDSLMGREPKDWDVCTNALPEDVLRVFRRFHVIKTGLKHGTVTVMVNRQPVEVTTYRIDGAYSDNRHPDRVQFVGQVESDLARRDFTVNAMAYSPTRGLVDAFGGREDLAAGVIRCVGEPDARFHEDGLRILRALRFAARYNFDIERETAYSVHRNRTLLENVSAERVFSELKGILAGAGVRNMLLAFPDVFTCVIPELAATVGFEQCSPHHMYDVWTHTAHAVQSIRPEPALRLTMLLHDVAKPACFTQDAAGRGHFRGHQKAGAEIARQVLRRLRSDNDTLNTVVRLVAEHDTDFPTDMPGMRRLIGKLGEQTVRQLIEVQSADLAAKSDFSKDQKKAEIRNAAFLLEETLEAGSLFTTADLAVNGNDLIQLGMKPGPGMKQALSALLNEVQEERLPNTREALLAYAAGLRG